MKSFLSKIGRFYPSSKTCHHCGYVKEDLSLSDRYYTCPNCGKLIERDLNAAMNILDEGLRNISAGTVDYTDGGGCKTCLQAFPNEVGIPQVFSLWVVQLVYFTALIFAVLATECVNLLCGKLFSKKPFKCFEL